jgi:transcriptional regulator with XRE-family HTH domain
MDDVRIGNLVRLVRQQRRWRQEDLAIAAHVSQGCVSKLERGQLAHLRVETIRSIARALEMEIAFDARWRGGELARLRDAEHAALVERIITVLTSRGWLVIPEFTFNRYGERGSVDILAWHPGRRALLIVEVKGRIVDMQDLLASVDRKRRLVPGAARGIHGWRPLHIGTCVVASGTGANRRRIKEHAATLSVALPDGGVRARTWIADPSGPLAAVWLVEPPDRRTTVPRRVRRPRRQPV